MDLRPVSKKVHQSEIPRNTIEALNSVSKTLQISIEKLTLEEASDACFYAVYDICKEKGWNVLKPIKNEIDHLVNSLGQSILCVCILEKNKPLFDDLINQHISLHQLGAHGNQPLHYAAQKGCFKFVDKLSKCNEVDKPNDFKQNPLHIAAFEGHLKIVKFLATEYPSLIHRNADWFFGTAHLELTPICLSIIKGRLDCVEFFLEKNPETANGHIKTLGSLLHLAIHFHQNHILKLFLNRFHKIFENRLGEKNGDGLTPLMLAAYIGNEEAVYLLNKKNVPLDAVDGNGDTALHYAVRGNQRNVVTLLIAYGADLRVLNLSKIEPYALAESLVGQFGDEMRTIKALINNALLKQNMQYDFLDYAEFPPENLALQGGGPRGIGLVGALGPIDLSALKRIVATSAGGLTAVLIATGYTKEEIETISQEIDLMDLLDFPVNANTLKPDFISTVKLLSKALVNPVGAALKTIKNCMETIWKTTGICQGDALREIIEKYISKKTGITLFTFKDLREGIKSGKPYKDIYLFATLIGATPQILEMHSELTEDSIWDDVPLSDAAMGSACVPILWKPLKIHIRQNGVRVPHPKNMVVVDGGLLRNLPVERFDRKKYTTTNYSESDKDFPVFNKRTLGISFHVPKVENVDLPSEPENIKDFLYKICQVFYSAETLIRDLDPYASRRLIKVNPGKINLSSFNMSKDESLELMGSGNVGSLTFFKNQKEEFYRYAKKSDIVSTLVAKDKIGKSPGFYIHKDAWIWIEVEKGKPIYINELLVKHKMYDHFKDNPIKMAFCECQYKMEIIIKDEKTIHPNTLEKDKAEIYEILVECQNLKFELS